jgi:hypothetical protein
MRGRAAEKIHAHNKKDGVNNARYNDPFPKLMLPDEMVHFIKGLDRYDDFFKQALHLNK